MINSLLSFVRVVRQCAQIMQLRVISIFWRCAWPAQHFDEWRHTVKRSAFVYTQITCFAYRVVDITHRNDSVERPLKQMQLWCAAFSGTFCILYSGLIYPKDRTRFTHPDAKQIRNNRVNTHTHCTHENNEIIFDRKEFAINLKNKRRKTIDMCTCVLYRFFFK